MNPIIFRITETGKRIALDAPNTGLTLRLAQMAIGTGRYTPTGTETALQHEVGRYQLSVAEITHDKQLVFSVSIQTTTSVAVSEMGLFDDNGQLFAIAAKSTEFLNTYPDIEFVGQYSLALDEFDVSKIELITDPHGGLALKLMTAHTAADHPHTQYPLKSDIDRIIGDMQESINAKMHEFNEMAEALKRQTLIPIGGLFLTMNHYTAQSLKEEKGYGTWIQVAKDRALVGAGVHKIGTMAGSDTHTLTIAQMPEHNHANDTFNQLMTNSTGQGTIKGSATDSSWGEPSVGTSRTIVSNGDNKPHNNRQKSLYIGIWQRVADDYKLPKIALTFTSDPQGTNIVSRVEHGKDAYLWVTISDYKMGDKTILYPKVVLNGHFLTAQNAVFNPDSLDHTVSTDSGVGFLKSFNFDIAEPLPNGKHLLFKVDGTSLSTYKNSTLGLGVIDETGREFVVNLAISGKHTDKTAWQNEVSAAK